MRFEVWAPRPGRVDLHLDGRDRPMVASDGGWWTVEVDEATAASRYGFRLDGGPARPDPRSLVQPDGIEGLSCVYRHGRFAWTDSSWAGLSLAGSVLYELHVGTFSEGGTLDSAIGHLGDLVDLGVDAVELMPLASASGRWGWGYDGVNLYAVHAPYGGPDALKRFVDAAHSHGLGVLLDVVYNHLGPVGNYLNEFGPYFTDRHHTPWGDAVNFDGEGCEEVRRFVIDNACMWLRDFHLDGLRLDAVHAIVDDSSPDILTALRAEVAELSVELGRSLVVVAESDENDVRIVQPLPEGQGMDAVWSDDWHHALHTLLTGEHDGYYEDYGSLEQLVKALRQAWVFDGCWSAYRERTHGSNPSGLPRDRFLVATQNHDQIGNRANGERLSMLVGPAKLRAAAALLLTTPFVPMLFQGEEWGASTPFLYFTDHQDEALARAVRDGRRTEFAAFGWRPEDVPDPQDPTTFERSRLDRSERARVPHEEMLRWYRDLLALRRREPDLHDPSVELRAGVEAGVVTVNRGGIVVLVNFSGTAQVFDTEGDVEPLLLAPGCTCGDTAVSLGVDGVAVLRREITTRQGVTDG